MAEQPIQADGDSKLLTKYHGEVSIFSVRKWDEICSHGERYFYKHNLEKVATTLINPDYVRYHQKFSHQFLYYKYFENYVISENVIGPLKMYMAVVIDVNTRKVCTVYPVPNPKRGKEYKPGERS